MRFLLALGLLFCKTVWAREITDMHSFGAANETTMYVFTSPSCAHCKTFHQTLFPELKKQYVETGKARLVIVDVPFDSASLKAVLLMRCLPPEKAERVRAALYEKQNEWKSAKNETSFFLKEARTLGMSEADFHQCIKNEQLIKAVKEQRDNLMGLYRVRGAPTLVVRSGSLVKTYQGANKEYILENLQYDIKDFSQE